MDENNSGSGGIGFCGLLTLIFIVLKLCKVIDWSWWWVLFPTWFPLAVLLAIILVAVILSPLSNREK